MPKRTPSDLADLLLSLQSLKKRRLTRTSSAHITTLERRAAALAAPIYVLPVELITYIFRLAAWADPDAPLVLVQVSSSWRAIARAYAPLWSYIKLLSPASKDQGHAEAQSAPEPSRAQLHRLSYSLDLSKQAPLDIWVETRDHSPAGEVTDLICSSLARTATLRLWNHGDTLPSLADLTPCPNTGLGISLGVHVTVPLRALDLSGFFLSGVEEVLHLLSHARGLRSLALRDLHWLPTTAPSTPTPPTPPTPAGPLSLPNLSDLLIDEWAPHLLSSLLPLLHTPVLYALTLSAHTCDAKEAHLAHFRPAPFPGSLRRVRYLRTRGCAFDDTAVLGLMRLMPRVESTMFHGSVLTDAFLLALARPTRGGAGPGSGDGGASGEWIAPALRMCYVHSRMRFDPDAVREFIDVRLPMPPEPESEPEPAPLAQVVGTEGEQAERVPRATATCTEEAEAGPSSSPSPEPASPASPASPTAPYPSSRTTIPTPTPTPTRTPARPSTQPLPKRAPLRLLGIFGVPHPTAEFRAWLNGRVGPEALGVPDWGAFRRRAGVGWIHPVPLAGVDVNENDESGSDAGTAMGARGPYGNTTAAVGLGAGQEVKFFMNARGALRGPAGEVSG